MSSRAGYFRLGLFIVGAFAATVVILLALGVGALLRPKLMMETYFDGSIQGLDVGAPIKLRGVTIGEVSQISFTYAHYQKELPVADRAQYVMVRGWLRPDLLSTPVREVDTKDELALFVERGLRVRMTSQGVTGINFLELDFFDADTFTPVVIDWTPEYLYIPSAPSTMTQFLQYADNIMRRVDRMDVESILHNIERFTINLNELVEGVDSGQLMRELTGSLEQTHDILKRVQRLADSPQLARIPEDLGATAQNLRRLSESPEIRQSLEGLTRSLDQLKGTVGRADDLIAGHEQDIAASLDNLRAMTDNLRALTEDLRRHPGAILNRPPEPAELSR
ncbi:Mammalian cell entry related domain-containing protein [Ectothiorhodospira sp. PHS-1]|uniref:MlaD family protein n=1 Tax=Ectothiorhodospira sp. PHS-1 TaxID=519989 RepID=UPI00024A812B|nr:MlaD family protein [Ectothiorhodospira sp. PHS-1]EHQ52045.1 Mammalian cell entry related domain-containing protein [Ectothiorhodospira sp. PHS-1]